MIHKALHQEYTDYNEAHSTTKLAHPKLFKVNGLELPESLETENENPRNRSI